MPKKYALCIGINNYPGTDMDLAGCVNDALDWSVELAARGFEVTRLLDSAATKAAMVAAFEAVIGRAVKNDTVVITFSGHGTCAPDQNGDEADGLDEALCPHDIRTGGPLTDDEIHLLFSKRRAGVKLVLIADSCHSGTVTRAAPSPPEDADLPRPRFMPMGNWLPQARVLHGSDGRLKPSVSGAPAGTSPFALPLLKSSGDLLLAGCLEGPNHFSYDARVLGRPTGAFTCYALKALKSLPPNATYADWHAALTPEYLPSATYPQTPQIVGSVVARARRIFS
jgi:hypothetical protein